MCELVTFTRHTPIRRPERPGARPREDPAGRRAGRAVDVGAAALTAVRAGHPPIHREGHVRLLAVGGNEVKPRRLATSKPGSPRRRCAPGHATGAASGPARTRRDLARRVAGADVCAGAGRFSRRCDLERAHDPSSPAARRASTRACHRQSADVDRAGGDLATIANAYGVVAVVLSSVTLQNDEMTLGVQLAEPRTKRVLWSGEYHGAAAKYTALVRKASGEIRLALRPARAWPAPRRSRRRR